MTANPNLNHFDQAFLDSVLKGHTLPDVNLLAFRDPQYLVAGQLHQHADVWSALMDSVPNYSQASEVLNWITQKVNVHDYFVHFKREWITIEMDAVINAN